MHALKSFLSKSFEVDEKIVVYWLESSGNLQKGTQSHNL